MIALLRDVAVGRVGDTRDLHRDDTPALYALGPVVDPSVTGLFSCSQIPTQANGYGGGNWDHLCSREVDRLMQRSDQELDVAARTKEIRQLGLLLAEDLPMLPLDVPANVGVWRSDRIAGIDPRDLSSPYGFFAGLSSWYSATLAVYGVPT